MKCFSFATTVLVSTMAKVALGKEVVGDEFFDVTIKPKCAGVDMDSLTTPEQEYVAEVLESTYNQVHAIFDSDMYLFDIEASPASPELTEALGRGLQYGGGGACNGGCASYNDCIDDASGYAADDPSQLCSNNDRLMLVTKNTKTHADRMWEKRVAQKLKEGPYAVFHGIGKCDISMTSTEANDEPDVLGATFGQTKKMDFHFTCKEGSMAALSAGEIDYLAESLLIAYAKSKDDQEIFNIKTKEGGLATNGMSFTADWGCYSCDQTKNKSNLRASDNKAWADHSVWGLKNAPSEALKTLNKCKINAFMFEEELKIENVAEAVQNA